MTTHFLCKNVKNASLIGMSTISKSLHFSYTNMQKLRTPNVHYIKHNTFTIQISQNCAHQMSTISITTHLLYKQAKIAFTIRPLYQSLHIYYAKKVIRRVLNPH